MPRQARIDIPGQMYHVMSRGIERGQIFVDDNDCADFIERLGVWLKKGGGKCLAWCLIPNHFHFLILRGLRPLSEIMHHVLTGYAVNYNGRHRRAGHLFQNRYKAIICDAEEYLLELVSYIHLNPLRANLVKDLEELEEYKWCGHAAALKGVPDEVLDRDALFEHFGGDEHSAMVRYQALIAEKARDRARVDLNGGGLLRSMGGNAKTLMVVKSGEKVMSDLRILGKGSFVESVLRAAGESSGNAPKSRDELLYEVERLTGIPREDILRRGHDRAPAHARAIYCYLCKEKAGVTGTELMRELGISQSAISRAIAKGRKLVESEKIVI